MMRHVMLAALLAGAWPAPADAQTGIDRVAWMQGCWQLTNGDRIVEENWTSPKAGAMLGTGRTIRAGKLVEHEFVLLAERDGRLAYQAHPSGQPSTTFMSKEMDDTSVVFEDPAHDFPQRVGYRRVAGDQLLGWIEGTLSGKPRRVEFPYRRVECPK
jgi:hypothetical protein